jgi:hypothetical protein
MAYKVAGFVLLAVAIAFIAIGVYSYIVSWPPTLIFQAKVYVGGCLLNLSFFPGVASRYCFNRAASRQSNALEKLLFPLALWTFIGLLGLPLYLWLAPKMRN